MLFEVRIPDIQEDSRINLRVVEARDWFTALREALKQVGENAPLRNVVCDLVEDGVYRVTESDGGRVFEIEEQDELEFAPPETATQDLLDQVSSDLDINQTIQNHSDGPQTELNIPSFSSMPVTEITTEEPKTEPSQEPKEKKKRKLASTMLMDFAAIIEAQEKPGQLVQETVEFRDFASKEELEQEKPSFIIAEEAFSQETPAMTQTLQMTESTTEAKNDPSAPVVATDSLDELTGVAGKYKMGMTTEMLADVFMRASEIHDYGEDKNAAANFVLELALSDVKALGGGVLFTDINSPEQVLWFEATKGAKANLICNLRIPLGQGLIGYYTQQGIHQIIPNVKEEPRYQNDVLNSAGLEIGPLLCVPISYNDRVWGCIILYNSPESRPFTQGELSIITYLAHTTGEYLSALN